MTVACHNCVHFRTAPYEARKEGCYLSKNMSQRQDDFYLDEQQIPGAHETINMRGDCPDFEEREQRPSFLQRLFSLGA